MIADTQRKLPTGHSGRQVTELLHVLLAPATRCRHGTLPGRYGDAYDQLDPQ
jgi:hypothetical protein